MPTTEPPERTPAPAAWRSALCGVVAHCVAWLRVVTLCIYPILGAAIAFYVVALSDQGVDLLLDAMSQLSWRDEAALQTLGTDPPGVVARSLLSGVSVLVAALSIWYPARQLLCRDFRFFPIDLRSTLRLRAWLPRLLAMLVPLGVTVGYARIAWRSGSAFAAMLSGLWLLVAFALVVLLYKRRDWLDALQRWRSGRRDVRGETAAGRPGRAHVQRRHPAAERVDRLSTTMVCLIVAACVFYIVLALVFATWPVAAPRVFGGTALIFFGIGGLTFIVTMTLAYWPLSQRNPTLTVFAAFVLLIMASWLDNHGMRPVDGDAAVVPVPLDPARRAEQWEAARHGAGCARAGPAPVLYVAAAGGGLRAAYWTSRMLEELSLQLGPDFDCSLFALSGVSGGSLGLAAYLAVNRDHGVARSPGASGPWTATGSTHAASRALSQDFLSPAVAGLLFYDAFQRVFPWPLQFLDRSRGLEGVFQTAFDGAEGQPFRHPLYALDRGSPRMPMLFLNATIVGDGRRAIQSNVDLADFVDVYDLGCPRLAPGDAPTTARISLASAVHNSARFAYVSPAGRIARLSLGCTGTPSSDARIVDGGYFENSGAATLVQLLCALEACDRLPAAAARPAAAPAQATRPVLLLIRNSPGTRPYCSGAHADDHCLSLSADGGATRGLSPSHFLPELTSPLRALLAVREQRERVAVVAAAEAFRSRGGVVVEAYLPILEKTLPEPPLGWSLSPGVRAGLDLGARTIVRGCRQALQAVFGGAALPPACEEPAAAQAAATAATRVATAGPAAATSAASAARPAVPARPR